MSQRPTVEKKRRRVLKALRDTPETKIDLIDYIKLRTRCTTGTAEKVILSGALTVDGEAIGIASVVTDGGQARKVVQRYVPSDLRPKIVVALPAGLA